MTRTTSIAVLGECGVGKTTLISTLLECSDGVRSPYTPTIGVRSHDESDKLLSVTQRGELRSPIRLKLWDISGSDAFDAMRLSHFKRSQGAIFVFDASSLTSLDSTLELVVQMKRSLPIDLVPKFPILLIGNIIRDGTTKNRSQSSVNGAGKWVCSEVEVAERVSRLNIHFSVSHGSL